MRQLATVCVIAVFLTGCSGPNLSDKIEGTKWAETTKRVTPLYRFNNGELLRCVPRKGIWEEIKTSYKIDGDFIVLTKEGKKEERMSITYNKQPNGKTSLTMGSTLWHAVERDSCPF